MNKVGDELRVIVKIKSDKIHYEVGKDGVTSITETDQGGKKTTNYRVKDIEGNVTFVGLLSPHEVVKGAS